MSLEAQVRRYAESNRLLENGGRLVVGVSGGPDSLAMLHILRALRTALSLDLHVVHVHHGLRGREADDDADFVMALAEAWGLTASLRRADVPALAAERRLSLEEAARQARYTALAEVASHVGARRIAVGHNADDQAETVLMHFVRGSGLAGLRGMRPLTPLTDYHLLRPFDGSLVLIRPLLATPRADIEAYCRAHELQPRFDRSNLDRTFFRNRLRHDVLPLLETLNPRLREVLRRTAEVLAADYDTLAAEVERAWQDCLLAADGAVVRFDLMRWRALPLSLQRATLRRAVWHLRRSLRDVTFVQAEDAAQIATAGETGARATLPGNLSLRVGYHDLTLSGDAFLPELPDEPHLQPGDSVLLDVPGEAALATGWRLTVEPHQGSRDGPDWQALLADRRAAPLDADALGEQVVLRTRQPGDRFQPQGAGGTQKVAHFMVNAKIPAHQRDRIPLLVAGESIAWVVGWRVDRRFVVRPDTPRVIVARFERF